MPGKVAIGKQDFASVIENKLFYVDKTSFIKEWWESGDDVTLITRPRRFGKTLAMSMTERFLSSRYPDSVLFRGLEIWKEEKYRKLQGTYPVIFLSFASVKAGSFVEARKKICCIITSLYEDLPGYLDMSRLRSRDREAVAAVSATMDDTDAGFSLHRLCCLLEGYYGKKAVILLDEYDTPMQEAYARGYWDGLSDFVRGLFNATFKTNPYLERAILTGITRVGRESMFSDLNNLEVVTATSEKYETAFGFTEEEVFRALEEYGLADQKQQVKEWYDGFTFGRCPHIYNPWSVINFLGKGKFKSYWANTSSNTLVSNLLQKSDTETKLIMEDLMRGGELRTALDEEVVFSQLDRKQGAVWSLLLAGGYLKVKEVRLNRRKKPEYTLSVTNHEVHRMFGDMFTDWFEGRHCSYNRFSEALLSDDVSGMNRYMNEITLSTFSYFDTGRDHGENFYHAFVLGLVADLGEIYEITSNRESGDGRYDVMLVPESRTDNGIIIEFKVFRPERERTLEETAAGALAQIEEKRYETVLRKRGVSPERIRKYGFAFKGKEVLVCKGGGENTGEVIPGL